MPALKRAYKAVAIVLLNTVILLAALEVATRLLYSPAQWVALKLGSGPPILAAYHLMHDIIRREPWGPRYLADAERYGYALDPKPYIGFTNAPYASQTINIGPDGFRVVPGSSAAPGALKVFVLGGSSVLGVGVPDWGTIPAYLQREVSAGRERTVRVFSYGVGYWISTQELVFLSLELKRGNIPDLVILFDGVTDIARTAEYGRAGVPVTPPYPWPAPSLFLSTSFRLLRDQGVPVPQVPFVDPPTTPVYPELANYPRLPEARRQQMARESFEVYAQNVRLAGELARAYGFRVRCFWQPAIFTTGKTFSADERQILRRQTEGYADQMRRVDALVRQERPRLPNVTYLGDALDALSGTVFVDWAHLLPVGNEAVARAIARAVRPLGSGPGETREGRKGRTLAQLSLREASSKEREVLRNHVTW